MSWANLPLTAGETVLRLSFPAIDSMYPYPAASYASHARGPITFTLRTQAKHQLLRRDDLDEGGHAASGLFLIRDYVTSLYLIEYNVIAMSFSIYSHTEIKLRHFFQAHRNSRNTTAVTRTKTQF